MSLLRRVLKPPVFAVDRLLYARGARSLGGLTLPHFLGLGPGQSGSTWLFEHLSRHPDVFMPPAKETHYFDRHLHEWSLGSYASLFREGADRVRGEITPGYSVLRCDRIALVRRLLPDVRLVLTVRDPVERSWSAARRVMPLLGATLEEIDDDTLFAYLEEEWAYRPANGARLRGAYEPGVLEGHYTRTLDNWLSAFPPEQLLVVLFDELRDDPAAYLRKVCRHIGVRTDLDWPAESLRERVNPNPAHPMPDRVRGRLEEMYRGEVEALERRLGIVTGWLS